MPLLLVLLVVIGLMVAVAILMPVSLILRYRAGKARQRARRWAAALNISLLSISIVLCLISAAFTSLWAPGALGYVCGGLLAGALLGVLGLMLTRWETTLHGVYFTPNAWLVLLVTGVVAARLAYAGWRLWHGWQSGLEQTSPIVGDSIRGSFAAGGIVLGYYFVFWIGVRRKIGRLPRV